MTPRACRRYAAMALQEDAGPRYQAGRSIRTDGDLSFRTMRPFRRVLAVMRFRVRLFLQTETPFREKMTMT